MKLSGLFSSYNLFNKILKILADLPKSIKKCFPSFIEIPISRIYEFIHYLHLSGYLLTGQEKHSDQSLKILYYGDNITYNYLSAILFKKPPNKEYIGKIYIWNVKKCLKNLKDVDALIIHTERFFSKFFQKKSFIVQPEWINLILDSSKTMDKINENFSRGAKKDVKKISRMGYTYELTQDPEKLKLFYNRMFLPYVSVKYGNEIPKSYYSYVKYLADRDKVLLVKLDDKYVCGGLVRTSKNQDILESMGILNGNMDYLAQGASTALNYFHIISAKERGIKSINYGDTRTFVNDGNFQFKRKWGMYVTNSKFRFNVFCIKFFNYNKSIESFLLNNPFIFFDQDFLSCFVLSVDDKPLESSDIYKLFKMYYAVGLSQICIFSKNGFSEDVKNFKIDGFHSKMLHSKFIERYFDIFVITEKNITNGAK